MWKFHDFSITQILREISFGDCRSAKSAILTQLEVLNFAFYEILHFLKAEIYRINKIQIPKIGKMTVFELLDSPKLISRKIMKFPHCGLVSLFIFQSTFHFFLNSLKYFSFFSTK